LLSNTVLSLAGISDAIVSLSHRSTIYEIVLYILLASPDATAPLLNDHDPNGKVRLYCQRVFINISFCDMLATHAALYLPAYKLIDHNTNNVVIIIIYLRLAKIILPTLAIIIHVIIAQTKYLSIVNQY
jgi:hypothetical protein